jgi:hypothetical protein
MDKANANQDMSLNRRFQTKPVFFEMPFRRRWLQSKNSKLTTLPMSSAERQLERRVSLSWKA